MTFTPADQAVRDRIKTELDRNMLVEAGAGTGKTTVLVSRIVEIIERGSADIDSLVVITFTEAAAAELSARVREELEKAEVRLTGEAGERVRTALDGLHRARIETIHAFTGSLLRERPVEAGLDPQFEMLDDVAEELLFNEVFETWLDELLTRGEEPIARALARGLGPDLLRAAAAILNGGRAAFPLRVPPATTGSVTSFKRSLAAAAKQLESLVPRCANPEADKGVAQIQRLLQFRDTLALADAPEAERILLGAEKVKSVGAQTNWDDAEDCRAMKREFADLDGALSQVQLGLREQALVELIPDLERFVVEYEQRRRSDGRAGFDDLLIRARDLLRDKLEVRSYFQARYQRILIDEFQDTDPIQAEIGLYLASDGQQGSDWRELKPTPGKLFLVGDPKQSIYRFRHADIAIYDAVKAGPMAGQQETIQQNFRSLPGVVQWINDVFEDVFGDGVTGLQAAHVPLLAKPEELRLDRPNVVIVRGDGVDRRAEEERAEEARRLAMVLRHAVGCDPTEKRAWPTRDGADGQREASWGDIAVLIKTRTALPALEEAFDAAEVPYRVEGGVSFFGRQEVRELVAILEAIDDPANQVSVLGALRSRAFACSDEDVLVWVADGGRLDFRGVSEDANGPVAKAMRQLAGLHRQRRGLSVPELVRRVLEQTRMVEFTLDRYHGAQGAANLLKVAEQARVFTAAGGGSLRELTRWLARQRDTEVQESEAGIADQGDDVVRVMTIHAAKGLEFPIVALPGLNGRPKRDRDPIAQPDQNRIHFAVGTVDHGFATPGYEQALADERDRLDAEAARLLYVGLTRARDHLVITAMPTEAANESLLQLIEPHFNARTWTFPEALLAEERRTPAKVAKPRKAEVNEALAEEAAWQEARVQALKDASAGLRFTAASNVKPWDRQRPLAAVEDAAENTVPVSSGPPLPIGDALHRTMETVAFPGAEDLEVVAGAACAEAGVSEYLDEVLAMARACLNSDAIKRAVASGQWRREVPFTIAVNGTGYGVGRIDLLFIEHGEIVIVDYKTDRVSAAAIDAATYEHRAQLAVYAAGAQQASGLKVRETVVVFASAAAERIVTVDEELLERGSELLAAGSM